MHRNWLWISLAMLVFPGTCAAGQDDAVMPLRIPDRAPKSCQGMQRRIYGAAQKQARYLLSTVHPWKADPALKLLTDSRSAEHWIRPNTGSIEGFAILYRFGPYDERIVGVSRQQLLQGTVLPMMRYITSTHVTGNRPTSDGKPWGDAWQSAYWAQMLGRAAWFLWKDLPADLRHRVRRVVAHEADRFVDVVPPHQIKGDTKAEENAWNSEILSVALLLLPNAPRRTAWERALHRWVLSSFLRPADKRSAVILDGRPVSEQFTGANIHDDFTLENHGFVHPDYMQCFGLSLGNSLDYALSGRRPPDVMLYNIPPIFENLKWFVLPDGGFVYPNGQDWTLFRNPCWLRSHLLMAVFGRDTDAWHLAGRSLDALEKMQARSASGNIFDPQEYFFASTQHDMFRSLGLAWLTLQVAQDVPRQPLTRRLGVRRLDPAGIILHRTPTAMHTLSWGARCMAQCVPLQLDRVVSPDQRNGIGHIQLAGEKSPLPIKVRQAEVEDDARGFTARLVIDHGRKIRATLDFCSSADGTWTMKERLVALEITSTAEIATGLVGILNNPHWIYEQGQRRIVVDGQSTIVRACSGQSLDHSAVTELNIDGVLTIRGDGPLTIHYQAASQPERGRATDRLYLNYIGGDHAWKEGQEISRFEVTMQCKVSQ